MMDEEGRSTTGEVPKPYLTEEEAKRLLRYLLTNVDNELPVSLTKDQER
jgi:hypothetical protein